MRLIVQFGGPLDIDGVRYNDITDQYKNQSELVLNFQMEIKEFIQEKKE